MVLIDKQVILNKGSGNQSGLLVGDIRIDNPIPIASDRGSDCSWKTLVGIVSRPQNERA